MSVLTRSGLRDTVKHLLAAAGIVGTSSVYSGRVRPLPPEKLPALLVYTIREEGKGQGLGADPQFDATITVVVEGRVKGGDEEALEADLDAKSDAALAALLTSPALTALVEGVASYDLRFDIKHEGNADHLFGAFELQLALRLTQVFHTVVTTDLTSIHLRVDPIYPADSNGTYPAPAGPAYTPPSAPRSQGPDGRAEIAAVIALPPS